MSKWSKEDKNSFNNSETFTNLEKNMVEKIFKLSAILKESQDTAKKVQDIAENLNDASESATELKNTMNSLAEDDMDENMESEDEGLAVKAAMIKDLEKMASVALQDKNYSDLYKIERAIQEIKDNG